MEYVLHVEKISCLGSVFGDGAKEFFHGQVDFFQADY